MSVEEQTGEQTAEQSAQQTNEREKELDRRIEELTCRETDSDSRGSLNKPEE